MSHMLYRGLLKTVPVTSITPGKITVLEGRLAKILNGPSKMLFLWNGGVHTLDETERSKLKEIVIEYEFDPVDLDPFEKGYVYDQNSGKYTRLLPVFTPQWQEIIDRKLLDTKSHVEFVSQGISGPRLPVSPEAYVVFTSPGSFSEVDVRRIAWFSFEYGFKMGKAAGKDDGFGPDIFNVPFEVALSGLLDQHRHANEEK